jgi:putative ABC transport system permease protein
MFARLAAICGALALFLMAIGFCGTIAHALAARTREEGVRLALGQSRLSLGWSMVREASLVIGLGVAAGIPAAVAAEHALHSVLFAASRLDLGVLAGAVALVVGIGSVAVALPAHRVASMKPMRALRHD